MKKTINFCGNCPFSYSDYDDYALGYSTITTCTLSRFLKLKDDCISLSDGDEELSTPNWCPLKTEEYTFNFKEFSTERNNEINATWKEIDVLQDYFETKEYYHTDFKTPEYLEKDEELKNLYTKLGELQNNEEETFDEKKFQEELNKGLDEIKEQLSSLEEFGNKLQDSLSKLVKIN